MGNLDKRRRLNGQLNGIPNGYTTISIDQSSEDPDAVTIINSEATDYIFSKIHRYLAKDSGSGQINICQLDDTNSNLYHDGRQADTGGSIGDVYVYIPEVYYKCDTSGNYYNIHISCKEREGFMHIPAQLVGAYLAWKWEVNNGLYSQSGHKVVSFKNGNSMSPSDIHNAALVRGEGYHVMNYATHRLLNWLFYAKYKTRDFFYTLGASIESNYSGVASNDMIDSTPTYDSYGYLNPQVTKFLGIETFSGSYEYIEGLHINTTYNEIIAYDIGYMDSNVRFSDIDKSSYPYARILNVGIKGNSSNNGIKFLQSSEYGDVFSDSSSSSDYYEYNVSVYDDNWNKHWDYTKISKYWCGCSYVTNGVSYFFRGNNSKIYSDYSGSPLSLTSEGLMGLSCRLCFSGIINEITDSSLF